MRIILDGIEAKQYVSGVGNGLSKEEVQKLIKPMEHTIATMNEEIKAYENNVNTSAHNTANNFNYIKTMIDGVKKDVSDLKTHFGNNAQIVDTIMEKLIALEKQMKVFKQLETGSLIGIPVNQPLITKTKYGKYQYEYEYDGNVYEMTPNDQHIAISNIQGKVAITPLMSKITTFTIYSI